MKSAENPAQTPLADQQDKVSDSLTGDQSKHSLRMWLKLLKSTKHVEAMIREKLRLDFDTTLPRFDVMAALYRFENGLKMTELSAALRVSNGNVTGIVERLVTDGSVLRVPVAGDKRAMVVCLTRKGREEFAIMASAHQQWISGIFSVLSVEQSTQLNGIIDTIEQALTIQSEPEHLP